MATIELVHLDERAPFLALLVSFEAGDALVADDAAGAGVMDVATQALGPTLDKYLPTGWRGLDLYISATLLPGDGLAVPDGTNKAIPHGYAAVSHSLATDDWTFNSVVDLNTDSTPAVELCLVASTDANGLLDAAEAYRVRVDIGVKQPGTIKAVYSGLPETFTADGAT